MYNVVRRRAADSSRARGRVRRGVRPAAPADRTPAVDDAGCGRERRDERSSRRSACRTDVPRGHGMGAGLSEPREGWAAIGAARDGRRPAGYRDDDRHACGAADPRVPGPAERDLGDRDAAGRSTTTFPASDSRGCRPTVPTTSTSCATYGGAQPRARHRRPRRGDLAHARPGSSSRPRWRGSSTPCRTSCTTLLNGDPYRHVRSCRDRREPVLVPIVAIVVLWSMRESAVPETPR